MVKIRIKGGTKISGEVLISGGKNASMPIIIASSLSSKKIVLSNVPFVADVTTLISLLTNIGMEVTLLGDGRLPKTIEVQTKKMEFTGEIGLEASKIRTSVLLIGPALARNGYVKLLKPGGCDIGERKIDFHLDGMQKLGAKLLETEHYLELTTNGKRLKGAIVEMASVSVGATENLIMAGVLAEGKTVLRNCAIEPEIEDLVAFLNQIGAKIEFTGEREITIVGVDELKGGEYTIMPDRIEALTYGMMACATGGEILLKNISKKHLKGGVETLEKVGIEFKDELLDGYPFGGVRCFLKDGTLKPIVVETSAYPGFATDLQPQLSVLMLLASGYSEITENIFEDRFKHVSHLVRMGAEIEFINKRKIRIKGGNVNLKGDSVQGTDLRACAALAMAGVIAKGETIILNAESIDRGYHNFVKNVNGCGGKAERFN
jgi:UDP-N-acetylglucosamine 1-carboxyvinyltransferase